MTVITRNDVEWLRAIATASKVAESDEDFYVGGMQKCIGSDQALDLAARIESLWGPHGFTREDVEWLEWLGRKVLGSDESLAQCDSLAARIAALLPPSDEKPPPTP